MDETPQAKFIDSREWGAFHVDCPTADYVPVCKILQAEGDRRLLRCNACGATGWHTVGVKKDREMELPEPPPMWPQAKPGESFTVEYLPELPPLPAMDVGLNGQIKFAFSEAAMRSYALAAALAERERASAKLDEFDAWLSSTDDDPAGWAVRQRFDELAAAIRAQGSKA